jgi:DASH complex subunit ASK1
MSMREITPIAAQAGEAVTPGYQDFYDDGDFNSDDDSLEDVNNTAHPSAAFLMASLRPAGRDDSFDSNDSDSDDDDGADEGLAPVHPFAQGYDEEDGFDDSFDDPGFGSGSQETETETLFGVSMMAQRRSDQDLIMLGHPRLSDTTEDSTQIARMASERVPDTPTPAVALYDQSSLH